MLTTYKTWHFLLIAWINPKYKMPEFYGLLKWLQITKQNDVMWLTYVYLVDEWKHVQYLFQIFNWMCLVGRKCSIETELISQVKYLDKFKESNMF